MEMVYSDESAMNLCLTLVKGDVDCSQFTILKMSEINKPGLQIEAGIIGASHFFAFDLGDQRLHEVFACTAVHTDSPRAYYGPLHVSGKVELVLGKVLYSFCSRLTVWEEGLTELECIEQQARSNSNQIGLVQQFPGKGNVQQSKTILWLRLESKINVRMDTVHSYPNERQIVFTTTNINLRKEVT